MLKSVKSRERNFSLFYFTLQNTAICETWKNFVEIVTVIPDH